MLERDATEFLRSHPPFDHLDASALRALVGTLTLEVHAAGAAILRQGDPAPDALRIVKQGLVRISARTGPGREPVLDYRGVGESFGLPPAGAAAPLEVSVDAVSDTVCYVAAGEAVRALLAAWPTLREFLEPAWFPRRVGLPPGAAAPEGPPAEAPEGALFTTAVGDVASREVPAVPAGTAIREAARLMSARRVGALLVLDAADRPAGIVTTADLRDRVLAAGLDPAGPVGDVMSAPVIAVGARDSCADALLTLLGREVRHLLVVDEGRPAGILSETDLLLLQGTSPLLLAREIAGRTSVEGLAVSARRVAALVGPLLRSGAAGEVVLRVITDLNDRIERRILDLAVAALGPAPLPWCWIVYGSAGRKEQTFKTDQDNALVFADPPDGGAAPAAAEYFGRLAHYVVDAGRRCGFAPCAGNFMASNPAWRQPLAAWKRLFSGWIEAPTPTAVCQASNFFDFRPLHGDLGLGTALREHLTGALAGRQLFLHAMAEAALGFRPPLGLFGTLRLPRDGEHPHALDVKRGCLVPLVNAVRIFALAAGRAETSTLERIAALRSHPSIGRLVPDLEPAFAFLALLRVRHQHERIARGLEPDDFVDPKRLGHLEERTLREACRLAARLLDELAQAYDLSRQI